MPKGLGPFNKSKLPRYVVMHSRSKKIFGYIGKKPLKRRIPREVVIDPVETKRRTPLVGEDIVQP